MFISKLSHRKPIKKAYWHQYNMLDIILDLFVSCLHGFID